MEDKNLQWIPLTKWKNYYKYPSQGCMRKICSRRKTNGAEVFLRLLHGRFYIDVSRFNEWMDQQQPQVAEPEKETLDCTILTQ